MCVYIGIENLAASAIIAKLKKDPASRSVSFGTLAEYGIAVVEAYNRKMDGDEAFLILSKQHTTAFLHEYSNYFALEEKEDGEKLLKLQDGTNTETLAKAFLAYFSKDIMSALDDQEALKVIK